METLTLQQDVINETYNDMKNLIARTVWKFKKTYEIEFEEYLAEANLLFLKAVKSHSKKAQLSTWVVTRIWYGLLDKLYEERNWKRQRTDFQLIEKTFLTLHPSMTASELVDEISSDAKLILSLTLNMPKEIIQNAKRSKNHLNLKISLKNYLRNIGWTIRRVQESIDEIQNAINN